MERHWLPIAVAGLVIASCATGPSATGSDIEDPTTACDRSRDAYVDALDRFQASYEALESQTSFFEQRTWDSAKDSATKVRVAWRKLERNCKGVITSYQLNMVPVELLWLF